MKKLPESVERRFSKLINEQQGAPAFSPPAGSQTSPFSIVKGPRQYLPGGKAKKSLLKTAGSFLAKKALPRFATGPLVGTALTAYDIGSWAIDNPEEAKAALRAGVGGWRVGMRGRTSNAKPQEAPKPKPEGKIAVADVDLPAGVDLKPKLPDSLFSTAPKAEPQTAPKAEPQTAPKAEPQTAPKAQSEPQTAPKAEPQTAPRGPRNNNKQRRGKAAPRIPSPKTTPKNFRLRDKQKSEDPYKELRSSVRNFQDAPGEL